MRGVLLLTIAVSGCIDAPEGATDPDVDAEPGVITVDGGNQLLVNPGFEDGVGVGWLFQPGGAPSIDTAEGLGVPPQSGEFVAEVGDSDDTDEVIAQEVEVPEGVTALTLAFHRCVLTTEPMGETAEDWDFCRVRSRVDGANEIVLVEESNLDAAGTCEWSVASVAVTTFTAGAPLEIALVASNDESAPTRCFYDGFELIPTY